jgi:hypothetical protein
MRLLGAASLPSSSSRPPSDKGAKP